MTQATHLLVKCAATGITARNISVQTLHSWVGPPFRMSESNYWEHNVGKATQEKPNNNIRAKHFVLANVDD